MGLSWPDTCTDVAVDERGRGGQTLGHELGEVRPDLDASPILVIGQMARLTQLFEPHLRLPFAEAELSNGDFDVLAALRRTGEPHTLTPGQLSTSLLVTTGAITKRIDRLEARGLVQRAVSPADSRGRLVTLTPAGVMLTDELIAVHLANEARLLAGLSVEEHDHLVVLLARLAESLDTADDDKGFATGQQR